MNRLITSTANPARAVKIEALANMTASFESFYLASGIVALVFIAEPPSAPLDPAPPPCKQAPVTSSSSAASRKPGQPIAPAAPATQPARQSRLWNAGPSALAALEARDAAERQAQLRQRPQRLRPQDHASLRAGPSSGGTTPRSGQPDNEIIFLCEDGEDDADETSIQFIDDTNES